MNARTAHRTPNRAGASAATEVRVSVTGRPAPARPAQAALGANAGKPGPTTRMHNPPPGVGGPAGAPSHPSEGLGGGVTRAAGAAAPRLVVHVVCCDPNTALCGHDCSRGEDVPDETAVDCRLCALAEQADMPCPLCDDYGEVSVP